MCTFCYFNLVWARANFFCAWIVVFFQEEIPTQGTQFQHLNTVLKIQHSGFIFASVEFYIRIYIENNLSEMCNFRTTTVNKKILRSMHLKDYWLWNVFSQQLFLNQKCNNYRCGVNEIPITTSVERFAFTVFNTCGDTLISSFHQPWSWSGSRLWSTK